jgi:hypothetical protein
VAGSGVEVVGAVAVVGDSGRDGVVVFLQVEDEMPGVGEVSWDWWRL